ncbi:MAG: hypothetical protein ACLTQE_14475 [Proteus mirabilis]|nr:hypothetical protein [Proteus mirabilis]
MLNEHELKARIDNLMAEYDAIESIYYENKTKENLNLYDNKGREIFELLNSQARAYANNAKDEKDTNYQYVIESCFDILPFILRHFQNISIEEKTPTQLGETTYSDIQRTAKKMSWKKCKIRKIKNEFKKNNIPTYGFEHGTYMSKKRVITSLIILAITIALFIVAIIGNDNLLFLYGLSFQSLFIFIVIFMDLPREKMSILTPVFLIPLPMTIYLLPFDASITIASGNIKFTAAGAIAVYLFLLKFNPFLKIYDSLDKK